jgi:hypothetical protein
VPSRLFSILVVTLALLGLAPAAQAASTVECGQIIAYTAPDPVAPSDGALTIGALAPWTIAADATLSSAVQANLASVAGTGPSCLLVDRDGGGVITALDFATSGSVTGPVVYSAGLPGEILADRLIIPTFITDAYPGLAAVFVTSQVAGTDATALFNVDASTGRFTGFEGIAAFCGAADLAGNGDGLIGAAIIPAAVLDAAATATLTAANGRQGCADVHTDGSIDGSGNLTLTTEVVITLAAQASPPATSTGPAATARPASTDARSAFFLVALSAIVFAWVRRAGRRT